MKRGNDNRAYFRIFAPKQAGCRSLFLTEGGKSGQYRATVLPNGKVVFRRQNTNRKCRRKENYLRRSLPLADTSGEKVKR